MKNSIIYRFITFLLVFCILSGISLPTGLYAISMDHCNLMQDMHEGSETPHSHLANPVICPIEGDSEHHQRPNETALLECLSMMHTASDESGFDCDCFTNKTPQTTEAPLVKKAKTQVLSVLIYTLNLHIEQTKSDNLAIQISDSYSSPPIFLVNESFLI